MTYPYIGLYILKSLKKMNIQFNPGYTLNSSMSLCIILSRWGGFVTAIFRNVEGWRGLWIVEKCLHVKSHFLNRSPYVSIDSSVSYVYKLLYGVPRGSLLGPLLFISYTTLLSTIISNSSTNHHLYAGETQLFVSFSAAPYSHNIALLETAISSVSHWMSANFLTLTSSKTDRVFCRWFPSTTL